MHITMRNMQTTPHCVVHPHQWRILEMSTLGSPQSSQQLILNGPQDEIQALPMKFATAAKLSVAAGFHGVQVPA